jgi:uncharacterized protein
MLGTNVSDDAQELAETKRWLERAVIGLNLCPFAKAVHLKQQIRWVLSPVETAPLLAKTLAREMLHLADVDATITDTTVLVHPYALQDFADYNDFLDVADELLESLGLDGVLQIASFHPNYQFADGAADDITHFTNRSPYPMLHLLREDSVARAVAAFPDPEAIFERNKATLQKLGPSGWRALFE